MYGQVFMHSHQEGRKLLSPLNYIKALSLLLAATVNFRTTFKLAIQYRNKKRKTVQMFQVNSMVQRLNENTTYLIHTLRLNKNVYGT